LQQKQKHKNRQPDRQLPNVLLLLAIGILAPDVVYKLHAASSKLQVASTNCNCIRLKLINLPQTYTHMYI